MFSIVKSIIVRYFIFIYNYFSESLLVIWNIFSCNELFCTSTDSSSATFLVSSVYFLLFLRHYCSKLIRYFLKLSTYFDLLYIFALSSFANTFIYKYLSFCLNKSILFIFSWLFSYSLVFSDWVRSLSLRLYWFCNCYNLPLML